MKSLTILTLIPRCLFATTSVEAVISRCGILFQFTCMKSMKIEVVIDETGEVVTENAFLCLCTDKTKHKLVKVYVSEEYDVKDESNIPSIAGRFVFMYNENGKLEVKALAEEPAKDLTIILNSNMERFYLQKRKVNKPADNQDDDPMCTLTTNQRVRICTLVFSATYFDGEFTFLPSTSNVDESFCVKKTISFRTEDLRTAASTQESHEEWMIRCLPKEYFFTYKPEFFLSRAYDPNTVFVYRWGNENEIFIENIFTNIRLKF